MIFMLDCMIRHIYRKARRKMSGQKVIRARTPVRIDFSGGWTDVALFTEESKGFVVNATINIYSYVTIIVKKWVYSRMGKWFLLVIYIYNN